MEAIRHSNVHSWWRRLYMRLRVLLGAAVKTHRVHWVTIGGVRYKRVTFSHASEAMRVMSNLERVAHLERLPVPVYQHERRVWLEFVIGEPLDASRPDHVEGVIGLFADLYREAPRRVPVSDTLIHQRLLRDLDFLREVGALTPRLAGALSEAAASLRPEQIWVGYEYIDPLCRNFIVAPGGVRAIDVEALYAESLLGIGLAKARLRWLDTEPDALLDTLCQRGAPDLAPQLDYATLSQLAAYSKQKVFRGRRRSIQSNEFERILERVAG